MRPRSVPCNGELLSRLRKQLQWTQAQLAQRAGYSERLIVKAESGGSIAAETLSTLCDTFCEAGVTADLEDLMNDPAARAREFIHALYFHESEVIVQTRHFLHEEVVFHFQGDPNIFPFAGEHRGVDAAHNAFRLFFSVLEVLEDKSELDDYEYLSTGTGAVVFGHSTFTPRGGQLDEPIKIAIRIEFQKGKMILFDDRFDTQAGERAFQNMKDEANEPPER